MKINRDGITTNENGKKQKEEKTPTKKEGWMQKKKDG
jgi:hypothetical protein